MRATVASTGLPTPVGVCGPQLIGCHRLVVPFALHHPERGLGRHATAGARTASAFRVPRCAIPAGSTARVWCGAFG